MGPPSLRCSPELTGDLNIALPEKTTPVLAHLLGSYLLLHPGFSTAPACSAVFALIFFQALRTLKFAIDLKLLASVDLLYVSVY